MQTICMKCQIIFSGKNKKNLISVSSNESAHSMVSVKDTLKGNNLLSAGSCYFPLRVLQIGERKQILSGTSYLS